MEKIKELLELTEAGFDRENPLKDKYPQVWAGFKAWMFGHHGIPRDKVEPPQATYIFTMSDGTLIFRVFEPGHSWYFSKSGQIIGEEDGGLDNPRYNKYKDELDELYKEKKYFKLTPY